MSTSNFFRERAQAWADNIVAGLLFVGGAFVIGLLVNHYAQVWWLTPKAAFVLAWMVALLVFVALSLLLKPKQRPQGQQSEQASAPQQTLPQSGINNAPHNEFNPHNEFKPTVIVNVPVSQEQSQRQSQSQNQSQSQRQEIKPPQLVPVEIGTRVEKAIINIGGELQEKSHWDYKGDQLREVDFAFAELYRGVDGSPENYVDVRAHILFFDNSGKLLFRV